MEENFPFSPIFFHFSKPVFSPNLLQVRFYVLESKSFLLTFARTSSPSPFPSPARGKALLGLTLNNSEKTKSLVSQFCGPGFFESLSPRALPQADSQISKRQAMILYHFIFSRRNSWFREFHKILPPFFKGGQIPSFTKERGRSISWCAEWQGRND